MTAVVKLAVMGGSNRAGRRSAPSSLVAKVGKGHGMMCPNASLVQSMDGNY